MDTSREDTRPIPIPRDLWLEDFRRGPLTVVVWALALLASLWLLARRESRGEFWGEAQATEVEVAATVDGRLEQVLVKTFEPVAAGQAVAVLDHAELEARMARVRAEVERLRFEWQAAEVRVPASAAEAGREWNADWREETRLRVELLDAAVELASDRVEEQQLALEVERQSALHASGIVARATIDDLRLQQTRLREEMREKEQRLAALQKDLDAASTARQSLLAASPPPQKAIQLELEALRLAAEAKNFELQELELVRSGLVLHAPLRGRVQRVLAQPGQAIGAGRPILVLASETTDQVVFFVPEASNEFIAPQARVEVAPSTAPHRKATVAVTHLSPTLELLPQRFWRSFSTPEYGRAIVLTQVADLQLTPGQRVTVRLVRE